MKLDKLAPYVLAAATAASASGSAGCGGNVNNYYTIIEGDDTDAEVVSPPEAGVIDAGADTNLGEDVNSGEDADEIRYLTRRELFTSLVYDVMGFPKADCNTEYVDVPKNDELCHALELMEKRVGGSVVFSGDEFRPEDQVNHAEMWKIEAQSLGFPVYRSECAEAYAELSDKTWFGSYAAVCDKQIPMYASDVQPSPANAVTFDEWGIISEHLKSYFEWTVQRIDLAEIMTTVIDNYPIPDNLGCISKFDDIADHTKNCHMANRVLEMGYMTPLEDETGGVHFYPTLPLTYGEAAMYLLTPLHVEKNQPTGCSGVDPNNFFSYEIDSMCEAGYADATWGGNAGMNMPRLDAYKAAWKYSVEN